MSLRFLFTTKQFIYMVRILCRHITIFPRSQSICLGIKLNLCDGLINEPTTGNLKISTVDVNNSEDKKRIISSLRGSK